LHNPQLLELLSFAQIIFVTTTKNFRLNLLMARQTEHNLKAERREKRNRPRMKVSGSSLKRRSSFAGLKAAKKK